MAAVSHKQKQNTFHTWEDVSDVLLEDMIRGLVKQCPQKALPIVIGMADVHLIHLTILNQAKGIFQRAAKFHIKAFLSTDDFMEIVKKQKSAIPKEIETQLRQELNKRVQTHDLSGLEKAKQLYKVAVSDDNECASVSIKKQLIWVQKFLKESKLDSKRDWYEYCVIATDTREVSVGVQLDHNTLKKLDKNVGDIPNYRYTQEQRKYFNKSKALKQYGEIVLYRGDSFQIATDRQIRPVLIATLVKKQVLALYVKVDQNLAEEAGAVRETS